MRLAGALHGIGLALPAPKAEIIRQHDADHVTGLQAQHGEQHIETADNASNGSNTGYYGDQNRQQKQAKDFQPLPDDRAETQ